jgi:thioredoxin 1
MLEVKNNKILGQKKLKILNFYSDWCPPCHAFMPNFIAAEKTFWKDYDFIIVNVSQNMELSWQMWVRWTPTIIILDWDLIVYNKSGVPNWAELKKFMDSLV